ncbi:hypothetical protein NDN08_005677 [Rhodosorus marinus]|uniref:ADP-ribosylation factor 1 n=1 Tax=Rhodosorus marinus TaxID=101924 RepID=A0AAV8V4T5_9RHOD|nr:hypothetical protein NDN08_005677 [Rhodosorus marinus]
MGLSFSKLCAMLVSNKEVRVLMVGLDGAGKTTILYKLKLVESVSTVPTIGKLSSPCGVGFNLETVQYKNINFTLWDIGGQDQIRPLWRYYFEGTKILVYVVDSNDVQRIGEARTVLWRMLDQEELEDAVILVFANKQDLAHAVSVAELTQKLALPQTRRRWFVQSCSATNGTGIYEGLDWAAENLQL